jgi:phenylacetate-CoA ligase
LYSLETRLPFIYTLSSAVDPHFFSIVPSQNPSCALMVGRLVPYKGFDVGIKAAGRLYRKGLIKALNIAGTGPEEHALRKTARDEDFPVNFHGHVGKNTVGQLFTSAAVLLCPSRTDRGQAEGTPTIILEAWAAGVPVVACASGGIPHLVRDGVNAVLTPENDVELLAVGAERALKDRASLVRHARERVSGQTWEQLATRVLDAYREQGVQL